MLPDPGAAAVAVAEAVAGDDALERGRVGQGLPQARAVNVERVNVERGRC